MGILKTVAELTLLEHGRRPFRGSVMQLGRQEIYFTYDEFVSYSRGVKVPLAPLPGITKGKNSADPTIDSIDDHTFFKSLGFERVHSLDYSGVENPTYVLDLNHGVPEELHGQYDLVYDGGTIEHVFHIPNVMQAIHQMLKVGGRVIHSSPMHNWVEHGFYMFSPTFFYDYYEANRYRVAYSRLVGYKAPLKHNADCLLIDFQPGAMDHMAVGGYSREACDGCDMFTIYFVAEKTADSVAGIIPQQRFYRKK